MVISHAKKFIFIHNYKVAGTSISHALRKFNDRSIFICPPASKIKFLTGAYPRIYSDNYHKHTTAKELISINKTGVFSDYYKFGFVRDPWDWQVSLYTFMLKNQNHHQHGKIKAFVDFNEYLDWRVNEEVRLQKNFFYDDNDNCLVDFIGRLENIDNDLKFLEKKLGIEINLYHLNKSRSDENKFLKYYNEKTIKMVEEAFAEDIKIFNYKVPILS